MTTTLNNSYLSKPATVPQGGSGVATNTTAYGLLAAGTSATGAIQNAGTGTTGQIYKSGGASALGSWVNQDTVGTWQLISSQVASTSATIAFTGLSSTYEMYKILISNVLPDTNGVSFRCRVSSNNGVSYDAGTTDYFYSFVTMPCTGSRAVGSGNVSSIRLDGTTFSSSTVASAYEITLIEPNTSLANNGIFWTGSYNDNTAATQIIIAGQGRRNATQVMNAIEFFFGTGNVLSGTFNLYGILT